MLHSTDYIDLCGPEPDVSDYRDSRRWDKWNVWFRKFSKHFPASNGVIEDGHVKYHTLLKSQRTRFFKEVSREAR